MAGSITVFEEAAPQVEPAQQARSIPSWARTDWSIAGGLFLVGLALALIVAPQWLDPQDDGLYMHQARIVMQGGVPYRDFLLHDAPLGNAWHALLLTLFGYDALVLRLAIIPFKAAMLVAVYALARPMVPRLPALLAALVVPIIDNNSYYTVAHVALNALALGLVAVALLAVWSRHRHPGWLVAAGIALGLMAGFKQNMALYILEGAALWLLDPTVGIDTHDFQPDAAETRRMAWLRAAVWLVAILSAMWLVHSTIDGSVIISLVLPIAALGIAAIVRPQPAPRGALRALVGKWGALLGGFVLATVPWLAWVIVRAGLTAVWDGLVVVPSRLSAVWFAPLRSSVPAFWWLLGLYLATVAFSAVLVALLRVRLLYRGAGWIAWGGLALWGLSLLFFSPLPQTATSGLIYAWIYFNLIVFWPLFIMVERLRPGPLRTQATLILITATFLALEMYPQLRRINANWCFVLFLPLVAWGLWEAWRALARLVPRDAPAHVRAVPALALALLPALCFMWIIDWRLAQFVDMPATLRTGRIAPIKWVPLDLPHFSLLESPENRDYYHQVNQAIESHTRPGEPIYCLYRQIAFYISSDRPPAVRNVYLPPGSTQADSAEVSAEVERAHVRVILVDNSVLDPRGPIDPLSPVQVAGWANPLRDYLTTHYHQVEPLGKWSLWERN